MKTLSVARVRADLANLLVQARKETVVIVRYGKPVAVLIGLPPGAQLSSVRKLIGQAARAGGRRVSPAKS